MKILILGGTLFVGRHLVEAALARGHQVTLFNRGKSSTGLFPQAEHLRGDRDGDLSALQGRRWDAVIDVSAYFPRIAEATAELLRDAVDHYTFISTVAVYGGFLDRDLDEDAPLAPLPEGIGEERNLRAYGPLKVACERAIEERFPGRTLVLRPGILVGPHDYTDRLPAWPRRIAQGGEVLAPGRPDRRVQFIDARDLASFAIRMIERQQAGIYNVSGPAEDLTMADFLQLCKEVTDSDATFTWVDEAFLQEQMFEKMGLSPINSLLLVPEDTNYYNTISSQKALDQGLTLRPLAETLRDTHAWDREVSERMMMSGLTPEQERHLLDLYAQQKKHPTA